LEDNYRDKLNCIFDDSPIGVMVLDNEERIIVFNKKQELLSRASKENVLNKKFLEVFFRLKKCKEIIEPYKNLIRNKIPFDVIVNNYTPQFYKENVIFQMRGNAINDRSAFVLFCEIERELFIAKKKIEEKVRELKSSKYFLSRLIDASPVSFISINQERIIAGCNKNAIATFGYKRSSIWGKNIAILFPNREVKRIEKTIHTLLHSKDKDKKSNFRTYGLKSNHEEFLIDMHLIRIIDEKGDIAVLLIIRDISEEERLRLNLIKSEKMAWMGEMIGELAHQLNNPIVGVINLIDILYRQVNPQDENIELIKTIKEASDECRSIIYNLLHFKKRPEKISKIAINDILKKSISLLGSQKNIAGIEIVEKYGKKLPQIHVNRVQCTQAFLNILVNSVEAMPTGGKISISTGIKKMKDGKQFIIIQIKDTGIGLSVAEGDKIFDPLFTTKDEGTGLGLSFTYKIIMESGGTIEARRLRSKGTSFYVKLPVNGG